MWSVEFFYDFRPDRKFWCRLEGSLSDVLAEASRRFGKLANLSFKRDQ